VQHLSRRVWFVSLLGVLVGAVPLGMAAPLSAGAATYGTSYGSTNLLHGDTASLSKGTGSWLPRQSKLWRPVRGVLAMTSTSSSWTGAAASKGAMSPATPNRVYSGTMKVRAARQTRLAQATLTFYDRTGRTLVSLRGQTVKEFAKSWTGTVPVVGLAPPGAAFVTVGEVVSGVKVGEVHFLTKPVLTAAPQLRRGLTGPLRTSGNTVYDAKGPIVLQGIHRRGLELSDGAPITSAELLQARRWGATMVRLSVSSAYWLPLNCYYDPAYAAKVDQAVKAVTALGMVALVDLHTNTLGPCGVVHQQLMADNSAIDFWHQVAYRYRTNPLVAFDLYNEPHWISDEIWLHGGLVVPTGGTPPFVAAGMQQMYDAVRSTGANNLVIVTGNDWGNRLPDTLVTGTNIVYGAHIYTCPISPEKCSPDGMNPTRVLKNWVPASATVPIAVTEFGWPAQSDGRYSNSVIGFARTHHWGWVAFAWDGHTDSGFSLVATQTPAYEPTPSGMPVLGALSFH
jgi:endoglucanase